MNDIIFSVLLYPQNVQGTPAPAKLHFFYKNAYALTKTRNDLEQPETI